MAVIAGQHDPSGFGMAGDDADMAVAATMRPDHDDADSGAGSRPADVKEAERAIVAAVGERATRDAKMAA